MLKLDWASYEAALYSVKNWHYSKTMPVGKTCKIGIWEYEKFIGCIIFSLGANNNAAKYFDLTQIEVCELTRVALSHHKTPVSRLLAIAIKMLTKQSPGIKLIFSYSDVTNQNHHGGIYQANGWLYLGERSTKGVGEYYFINGKKIHGRSARAKYGSVSNFPKNWRHCPPQTKHLYVKILDKMYKLKYPIYKYPKKCVLSVESSTASVQDAGGGESPTNTLQLQEPING